VIRNAEVTYSEDLLAALDLGTVESTGDLGDTTTVY
jgi:hypothetical protein